MARRRRARLTGPVTTTLHRDGFARRLRDWRTRRRVSQLELAIRTETSQRHVSFLEQGRSRPGRAMVLRLAESLELDLRDRNDLLLAAGFAPAFPENALDSADLAPVHDALRSILDGHMPYPAVVVGPYGTLVAANAAFALFTEGVPEHLRTPPIDVHLLALHPEGVAARVRNLPEWGRHVVESLRRQAERRPDPVLAERLAMLEDCLPPDRPEPGHLGFAAPLRLRSPEGELRLITTLTSFATATDVTLAELHLEAFLPADAETARVLRERFGAG